MHIRSLLAVTAILCTTAVQQSTASKKCSNKFAESAVLATSTTECKTATRSVGYTAKGLSSCYRNTGLYFTDVESTCTKGCMEPTIKAAKYIAEHCSINESELQDPPSVYYKWSNERAVRAVCTPTESGDFCLSALSAAQVQAETLELSYNQTAMVAKYNLNEKDWPKELGCNLPCTKELYEAVDGDYNLVPVKYLFGSGSLKVLFKSWEDKCDFKRSGAQTSVRSKYPPLLPGGPADNESEYEGAANNTTTASVPAYPETKPEVEATPAYPETESEEDARPAYPETKPQKEAEQAYPETKEAYPED